MLQDDQSSQECNANKISSSLNTKLDDPAAPSNISIGGDNQSFVKKKEKKIARTPSGCVITNPASDIRKLFSPKKRAETYENKQVTGNNSHQHKVCVATDRHDKHDTEVTQLETSTTVQVVKPFKKRLTKQRIRELKQKVAKSKSHSLTSEEEETKKRKHESSSDNSLNKSNLSCVFDSSLESEDCSYSLDDQSSGDTCEKEFLESVNLLSEIGIHKELMKNKRYKMETARKSSEQMEIVEQTATDTDANCQNTENPEFMDLRSLMMTLTKTTKQVEEMQKKINSKDFMQPPVEIVKDAELQKTFDHYDKKIEDLGSELEESKRKIELMTNIMSYNQQITDDMIKRLDTIELANAKRTVVLTGLSLSSTKSVLIEQIYDLFKEVLSVEVYIDDAYKLGEYPNAPVIITLGSMEQKRILYSNKSKLNTIKGEDDRKIYLNDYLPTAVNEKRIREREIIKQAKADNPGKKVTVEYTKTGIKVQGNTYRKLVHPPKPMDLLDLKVDECDRILKIPVTKGSSIIKSGNTFIGYACDVGNIQQVRDVYLKTRLLHPKARHIICAFNLPQHGPQYQDYCDDEEYSSARKILQKMVKADILNKAIYVVRYCGEKLGQVRYDLYLNAAENAMNANPYNAVRKCRQSFEGNQTQTEMKLINRIDETGKKQTTDPPTAAAAFASLFKTRGEYSSVRGRGSSRGRGRGRGTDNKESKTYVPKPDYFYKKAAEKNTGKTADDID